MEDLRNEIRQLRRALVAVDDTTGPTRGSVGDQHVGKAFRHLEALEALAGIAIEAHGSGPRFPNVSCSQCGASFGPGDNGYSHCMDHAGVLQVAS